jgi:hypothetical protein
VLRGDEEALKPEVGWGLRVAHQQGQARARCPRRDLPEPLDQSSNRQDVPMLVPEWALRDARNVHA